MCASAAQMWDVIRGTVTHADTGLPIVGVRVVVMDADRLLDDVLGEATTDAAGVFSIEYDPARFGSPLERAPDVYVKVFDQSGRLLVSTRHAVLTEAPSTVELHIEVPAESPV